MSDFRGARLLDLHRRLLCAGDGEPVCWWYLGEYYIEMDGHPEMLVMQAENLMIYRAETLAPDSYAIHWIEIGTSTEPATNAPLYRWYNPVIGREVAITVKDKPYGPGRNVVTIDGDGLDVDLSQPGTSDERVALRLSEEGGRLLLVQQEDKRFFRLGGDGTDVRTILSFYADSADAADSNVTMIPAHGFYKATFGMLPPFAELGDRAGRIVVRGSMRKSRLDEIVYRPMWDRIRERHPGFFDGDRLVPVWDAGEG